MRDSSLRTYEFGELGFDYDWDFDPRTEMIVGSDIPFLFDTESWDEWASGSPVVFLRLYELGSAMRTVVATSVAAEFAPRWIGEGIFEFTDPGSGKRVTKRLESLRGGRR